MNKTTYYAVVFYGPAFKVGSRYQRLEGNDLYLSNYPAYYCA